MACCCSCWSVIEWWTLPELVGAFLDLSIAFLLLCGSALAFLASSFLSLFGLHLPCPCSTAQLCHGNNERYHLGLLVSAPQRKIAEVHMSVRSRFPFDDCRRCFGGGVGREEEKDGGAGSRIGLVEKEEEFGSVSRDLILLGGSQRESGSEDPCSSASSSSSVDGWVRRRGGSVSKSIRLGLHRRRRSGEVEKVKSLSLSFQNPPPPPFGGGGEEESRSSSPFSNCEQPRRYGSEGSSTPLHSRSHCQFPGNVEFPGSNTSSDNVLNWAVRKGKAKEKDDLGRFNRDDEGTIRVLEQALEEEQSARAALYIELEKERSAAASAADEAMAMIERLQMEKASIEMNARQYQRMVEEKTAYDEEEMEILKEIVMRRETELYVLGKEVEMYRQLMISGGELNGQHVLDVRHETMGMIGGMPHSSEHDAVVILQQTSESTGKKEMINYDSEIADASPPFVENQTSSCGHGKESLSLDLAEKSLFPKPWGGEGIESFNNQQVEVPTHAADSHLDFKEKGILSVDIYASHMQSQLSNVDDDPNTCNLNKSHEHNVNQKVCCLSDDGREIYEKIEDRFPCGGTDGKTGFDENGMAHEYSHLETDSRTFDVHGIDDKLTSCGEDNVKEVPPMRSFSVNSLGCHLPFEPYVIKTIEIPRGHSDTSQVVGELNIHRSSSEMARVRCSLDSSLARVVSSFDLGKNSVSIADNERSKLETEIGDLRKKLRIVQQGREKLNFSVEHMQKENFQLQLLDQIASQLQEIRQLAELGKATRQPSLPPPSSKVNSKKGRCRSMSWGVHGST